MGAILFSTQSALGSEVSSFYIGSKAGFSHFKDACVESSNCDNKSISYSVYSGYQFTDNFSLELELLSLGSIKSSSAFAESIGAVSSFKVSYPVGGFFDLYGKLGAGYLNVTKNHIDIDDIDLITAVGFEVPINNHLSFLGEYQYLDGIGKSNSTGQADVNNFQIGLTYRFPSNDASFKSVYYESRPSINEETRLYVGTLFFDYNSDEPKGFRQIENAIRRMSLANDNVSRIDIVGYTDNHGGYKYNKSLSLERAKAVSKHLNQYGFDYDKMNIIGRSEENPILENNTSNARAINRRVNVYFVK